MEYNYFSAIFFISLTLVWPKLSISYFYFRQWAHLLIKLERNYNVEFDISIVKNTEMKSDEYAEACLVS